MNLEEELDGLYSVPLADFVRRRNELAKRLKAEGEKEAAGRVKTLPKPSLTAWAVNRLAFRAGEELAALMAAGAELRAAHLAAPAEQQAASKGRRAALGTLLEIAGEILAESGQTMNRTHRQRIQQSLEALSSREPESDEPGAGRLSRDLEPAGFDALAGLAPALEKAQADRPKLVKPKEPPAKSAAKAAAAAKATAARPEAPQADRRAEAEARRRDAVRRTLDRQIEEADAALGRLEEKRAGLLGDAETAAAELETAKGAAAELVKAALEAERLAREARRIADGAGEKAQRARFAAESAAAALKRADNEREKLRRKREGLEQERGRL